MVPGTSRSSNVMTWFQAVLFSTILVTGIGPIHHGIHLLQAHDHNPSLPKDCCHHHEEQQEQDRSQERDQCPECQALLMAKPMDPAPVDLAVLRTFDPVEIRVALVIEPVLEPACRLPAIRGPPSFTVST